MWHDCIEAASSKSKPQLHFLEPSPALQLGQAQPRLRNPRCARRLVRILRLAFHQGSKAAFLHPRVHSRYFHKHQNHDRNSVCLAKRTTYLLLHRTILVVLVYSCHSVATSSEPNACSESPISTDLPLLRSPQMQPSLCLSHAQPAHERARSSLIPQASPG